MMTIQGAVLSLSKDQKGFDEFDDAGEWLMHFFGFCCPFLLMCWELWFSFATPVMLVTSYNFAGG